MSDFDKMTLAELRMAIAEVQGWQNIRTVDGPTPEGLIIAETPDFEGCDIQQFDTVTLPDWPNSDSDCAALVNDIVGTDRNSIQTGLKWVGEKYRPGYYEAWALISWKNAPILSSCSTEQGATANLRVAICKAYLQWRKANDGQR